MRVSLQNCTHFAFLQKYLEIILTIFIFVKRGQIFYPFSYYVSYYMDYKTVSTAVCKWSVLICLSCFCTLPAKTCMLKKERKSNKKIKHRHVITILNGFFFYCCWLFSYFSVALYLFERTMLSRFSTCLVTVAVSGVRFLSAHICGLLTRDYQNCLGQTGWGWPHFSSCSILSINTVNQSTCCVVILGHTLLQPWKLVNLRTTTVATFVLLL